MKGVLGPVKVSLDRIGGRNGLVGLTARDLPPEQTSHGESGDCQLRRRKRSANGHLRLLGKFEKVRSGFVVHQWIGYEPPKVCRESTDPE
ncbi:MAG: hypothetical protein ACLQVF_47365 [Isosphaeraceae bacterium]